MTKNLSENQRVYLQTTLMVVIVIAAIGGWFWWSKIYNDPKNIFNSMLSNSLNTYGVTKSVTQEDESGKLAQVSQAQFGARNLVDIKTTITQATEGGESKVVTRTIGTGKDNYLQYLNIDVPAPKDKPAVDFSPVVNVWARQDPAQTEASNPFSESLYGAVLFGYLPSDKRNELLNMMKDKNIYKVDYSKLETKKQDGKTVIVYPVEIASQPYVELLKRYDEMLGLKLMSQLSAEDYAQAPAIKLSLSVDKVSRNLMHVSYTAGAREEAMSGYGIHRAVDVPKDVISDADLEGKLQNLLGAQE